jgi:hypothetical protein
MLEFFMAGGFPMWFLLIFGGLSLAGAVLFARRPDAQRLASVRALSVATLCSVGAGVASCFAAVGYNVPQHFADEPNVHMVVLTGIAESMSPAIMGLAILSITWLIVAVGHRRLRHAEGPTPAVA